MKRISTLSYCLAVLWSVFCWIFSGVGFTAFAITIIPAMLLIGIGSLAEKIEDDEEYPFDDFRKDLKRAIVNRVKRQGNGKDALVSFHINDDATIYQITPKGNLYTSWGDILDAWSSVRVWELVYILESLQEGNAQYMTYIEADSFMFNMKKG